MALVFTDEVFDGKTVSVLEISTDQFILESALASFDKTHLDAAITAADGDVEVEIADYIMPNGQAILDYYAMYIRSAAEIGYQYQAARARHKTAASVVALEDRVADLEAAAP